MPIRELSELQSAVLDRFGCDSIFRGAVLVREQFLPGGSVWSGTVSVFDLIDHPTAASGTRQKLRNISHGGAYGTACEEQSRSHWTHQNARILSD